MRIITILILLSTIASCQSESKQKEKVAELYQSALDNTDAVTARVALTQLLQLDPDNVVYKDSLARLFIQQGNYEGGTKLAQEIHDLGKADVKLQELLGLAYQQISEMESSDAIFDGLFKNTGEYRFYYQKVAMSMNNQPIFDSLSSNMLAKIEADSTVALTTIDFPTNAGTTEQVPLEAAIYYLVARQAIEMQQDFRKSEDYYIRAIKRFDPFYMARKDLSDIYALAQQQNRR